MAKSDRIGLLADLTQGHHTALDIGTDHGLVLKTALDLGHIEKGIASDIGRLPLSRARKNLKGYPVDFVLSDGFSNITQAYDLVIIAGMGAFLIATILKDAPDGAITYLLQPNDKPEALRRDLCRLGFLIEDEFVVKDRYYHVIIKAKRGLISYSEDDLLLGPVLRFKLEAKPYYRQKKQQLETILSKVDDARRSTLLTMIASYEKGLADAKD
ncbi:MAG: SAM-dependent methyltransferase [Acholeplasmataceae bacterium]|nr:MAG: SAM-dependent methyltransferase [Acholeplasmataceae bacterium]